MKDEKLLKEVAVNTLANPRANRSAARLARGFLHALVERQRLIDALVMARRNLDVHHLSNAADACTAALVGFDTTSRSSARG